jgi:hypothetical protein
MPGHSLWLPPAATSLSDHRAREWRRDGKSDSLFILGIQNEHTVTLTVTVSSVTTGLQVVYAAGKWGFGLKLQG